MSITQTVEVPASRRLTIDVPREVPVGQTILTFTPASDRRSVEQKPRMTEAEEIELINRNAEWLNKEAEDALAYQSLDAFEEDLERLTPQELAVMHGTVVPFNLADIVFDRDDERLSHASKEGLDL